MQLLEKCTSHEDSRYLLELETAEVSGAAGAALAALNVVEVNDFKNLVHLSLRWACVQCVVHVNGRMRVRCVAHINGSVGAGAGQLLQPRRPPSSLT